MTFTTYVTAMVEMYSFPVRKNYQHTTAVSTLSWPRMSPGRPAQWILSRRIRDLLQEVLPGPRPSVTEDELPEMPYHSMRYVNACLSSTWRKWFTHTHAHTKYTHVATASNADKVKAGQGQGAHQPENSNPEISATLVAGTEYLIIPPEQSK